MGQHGGDTRSIDMTEEGRREARHAWLRVAVVLALLVASVAACGQVPALGNVVQEPEDAAASRLDFDAYLRGYGQRFDPAPEPVDGVDWHPAIADFPTGTARVSRAVFGNVSCVDPSLNCAARGLARPGDVVPIWLITFTDPADGGCPEWATVDPAGAFINGSGPPC
jgi:hypothetical protein